jgi:adenylate cyclase
MKIKKIGFWYACVVVIVVVTCFSSYFSGLFTGQEYFFEDRLTPVRAVNSDIIILAIDNDSLKKIGQWPWPRAVFAEAFEKLRSENPKVVLFDVVLADASRLGNTDDLILENSLRQIDYPIVFPVEGQNVSPDSSGNNFFATGVVDTLIRFSRVPSGTIGHVNLLLDRDGIARFLPEKINIEGKKISSASFVAAKIYDNKLEEKEGRLRIAYAAQEGAIRKVSFSRLLEGSADGLFSGKIVVVGATAPDLHDEKPTPISAGAETPGVEIQAHAVNTYISGYKIIPLNNLATIFWLFLSALIPVLFVSILRKMSFAVMFSILAGFLHNAVIVYFFGAGIASNIVHINLAWILALLASALLRYLLVERERRGIKSAFSKYVSKSVLELILENPESLTLGGEERKITVFFSDIRGFTTLSEKLSPTDLVRVINLYFSEMTDEVLKHGGVLDKYIGDAIMAFWGAPLPDDKQENNAVKAALAMLERLKKLNERLKNEEGIEINIGIGLYTGRAIVGNIGSDVRFDYTAMGDTVNVSSRLEGLNKEHGTHIIIGETTKQGITLPLKFRTLGTTSVKGRSEPLLIYTIEGTE